MSSGRIFLVGQSSRMLTPMQEEPYGQEIVIQELLASYPDLLAGDQMTPDDPRRWLLITREMPVPDDAGGAARWSLDHLFVDQDGVPTFVECKRAADTRSRREVVAQMLDYAANGIAYWPIDHVIQAAAETADRRETTLDVEVRRLLSVDNEETSDTTPTEDAIGEFWRTVERNLRNGNVRLIFVAEETSRELRRLIEFLNEKLAGVDVLAVEIKQYLGHGQQVLVPRLVGLTEAARINKVDTRTPRRRTNRAEFLEKCSETARTFFDEVLDTAIQRGHVINWGELGHSIRATTASGRAFTFAYGYPPSTYEVYTRDIPGTSGDIQALKNRLVQLRPFAEAGQYTIRARVTPDDADVIRQAHATV